MQCFPQVDDVLALCPGILVTEPVSDSWKGIPLPNQPINQSISK